MDARLKIEPKSFQHRYGLATATTVDDDRRILFEGVPTYLSPATTKLLGGHKPRNPSAFWTYKGTVLSDLWERYRDALEEASPQGRNVHS